MKEQISEFFYILYVIICYFIMFVGVPAITVIYLFWPYIFLDEHLRNYHEQATGILTFLWICFNIILIIVFNKKKV